jgi:hypothetical protein
MLQQGIFRENREYVEISERTGARNRVLHWGNLNFRFIFSRLFNLKKQGKEITLTARYFRRSLLSLTAFLIITQAGLASGQSVFNFIRNDASARFAGIGGSAVALRHDSALLFYNPSGLYGMNHRHMAFSYFRHVVDINSGFFSIAQEFDNIGWFGAGITYVDYGTQTEVDHLENILGTFKSTDIAMVIGYANRLYGENLAFGVNAKLFYSTLTPSHSSVALAADLGIQYFLPEQELTIGASILNLGRQVTTYESTRESLPIDMKIGISKGLEHLPLVLSVNFHHLTEDTGDAFERLRGFTVGGEFTVSEIVRFRFGYRNEMRQDLQIGSTIGLAGFATGFGIHYRAYEFDYGFTSLGKIGSLHHVTLGYSFR